MTNESQQAFPLSVLIGLRYLRSRKSNRSISFYSFISLTGLALGVAAIIVVLSVMNGFESEMQRRILGMLPHVSIENRILPSASEQAASRNLLQLDNWQPISDDLMGNPVFFEKKSKRSSIVAAAPYVQMDGMLSKNNFVKGIRLVGILPEKEETVSVLDEFVIVGNFSSLQAASNNVIVGSQIARDLGLVVGDNISLIFPRIDPFTKRMDAAYYQFQVSGFFGVGAEADEFLAFVHITDASQMKYGAQLVDGEHVGGERIDGIRLKLNDVYAAEKLARPLQQYLEGSYKVTTWTDTYGQLFQTVKLEKVMTASMLMLIVLVAAFNIVSSLNMLVSEKHGSVAVLRTMGYSQTGVVMIFFVQGLFISLAGVFFGALSGSLIAWYLPLIIAFINNTEIFWVAPLQSEVQWSDVFWISAAAFFISIVSSAMPAMKAARIQPADAVRYH